jgi:mannitol/fructose-specific phosphotransferase system IIA component (Ntr-type)
MLFLYCCELTFSCGVPKKKNLHQQHLQVLFALSQKENKNTLRERIRDIKQAPTETPNYHIPHAAIVLARSRK